MSDWIRDVGPALRACWRTRGLTTVIAVTFAVAIAVTVSTFAVLYAVRLRPLPFPRAEALVTVGLFRLDTGIENGLTGSAVDVVMKTQAFDRIAYVLSARPQLTDPPLAEEVRAASVSAGFFDVLGVPPALGRAFALGDVSADAARTVVLGHGVWKRRFKADPKIVGRAVRIGDDSRVVIGVMPPGFTFPEQSELWLPEIVDHTEPVGTGPYFVIARIKPGIGRKVAESRSTTLVKVALLDSKARDLTEVRINSLSDFVSGGSHQTVAILFAAGILVLAVACSNNANLLLARGCHRQREFAIRSSLGAAPRTLARQLLTEGIVLSTLGALGGVFLAHWGLRLSIALAGDRIPRLDETNLNVVVLLFAVGLAVGSGVIATVAPVVTAIKSCPADVLAKGGSGAITSESRLARLFIAGQVATTAVLLVITALLVNSFVRLQRVDTGVHVGNALIGNVTLSNARYRDARERALFYRTVLTQARVDLHSLGVAFVSPMPLSEALPRAALLTSGSRRIPVRQLAASDRYFETLGIPLLAGRDFEVSDRNATSAVAIVNEVAAGRISPGWTAIGRSVNIRIGARFISSTIIGVAADVREQLALDPRPQVYLFADQNPPFDATLVIRTDRPPMLLAGVQRVISSADPLVPLANVTTWASLVSRQSAILRFETVLLSISAVVAAWLTITGIASVVAYSVKRRQREIAVRMAVGANELAVVALIMRQSLTPILTGLVIGIIVAINVARLLNHSLYQITPSSPTVYAVVALSTMIVTSVATYLPARRAANTDSSILLREE